MDLRCINTVSPKDTIMQTQKILFILKRREDFDPTQHTVIGMQTGLYNSAKFIHDMLVDSGIDSNMVIVVDNNDIDREVTKHKPTHVIIEALWVVPSKFSVLCKLHPDVNWIIRLHSELPFLAQEGMSFDWIGDYLSFPKVIIAANAPRMFSEVKIFASALHPDWTSNTINKRVSYLPNFYPQQFETKQFDFGKPTVDVGCFGAVRPFKNTAVQAIAALKFARMIGKKLNFHINARVEQKGEPIINTLRGMFQHLYSNGHQLIFHSWVPREEFVKICASMDIGMQVSFSETFNIVGCDFISQGVPFIGSVEVPWASKSYCATPTNSEEIANMLQDTYISPYKNIEHHQKALLVYTNDARRVWLSYFNK